MPEKCGKRQKNPGIGAKFHSFSSLFQSSPYSPSLQKKHGEGAEKQHGPWALNTCNTSPSSFSPHFSTDRCLKHDLTRSRCWCKKITGAGAEVLSFLKILIHFEVRRSSVVGATLGLLHYAEWCSTFSEIGEVVARNR